MDRQQFRKLLLHHHANHGPVIVRYNDKYHMIPYNRYEVIDDPLVPHIEVCVEEEGNYKIPYFRHNLNTYLWLVDSKESKRLKTLGKEEKIMSKPDVIIGLVAVPQKAAQIVKVIADPKAKVVVVKFTDGATEVVHCSKDDEFDVYVGVAIAEARHKYGTTSRFHKVVNEVLTIVKPKAKKVKTGPVAPGQEPVKKPTAKKTTKKSPAKKK